MQPTGMGVKQPAVKTVTGAADRHHHPALRIFTDRRTSQHRFHAGHHDTGDKRFGDVIIRAHFQTDDHVGFRRQTGEHNHGQIGELHADLL